MALAPAAFLLASCGHVDLTSYAREEFPVCQADGGAWAGEPRAARYIRGSFEEFDRQFGAFLGDLEQAAERSASEPRAKWPTRFAPLHEEMKANIARLGRVLPRMNRPVDVPPLAGQFEDGAIWWPLGDHHTEYLGVALSQEFVDHQNLGEHLAIFLSSLERVEAQLLDLKYAEPDDAASDLPSPQELAAAVRSLREDWEDGARPGMMRVIYDRPDIPDDETLSARLQARVAAICAGYDTCSGGEGRDCTTGPGE
ncbi:hypothetical protein I5L01_11585 [Erythrobacter sp. YJ-T3-07]|uniref:hypothetical protein n=1 Tax=Erythrobacter sp. YJ-T3-07 TaxID=2793063 RepID=UPI0018D49972|nr:hypothetical protein [Erythrobacter sp. YJ-T3-07]MBH1944872.1 hypothetical protein [Erythrobacter sp. YJ-T3-07]